jgi:Tfp pilus assembly protein PilF
MGKRFTDVEISGAEVDKANYAMSLGKYTVALRLMQQVLSEHPDNSVALCCLADVYLHQQRYPEAEKTILETLRQDPHYSGAHQIYARVARKLGNYDLSERAMQTAIEVKPTNWPAYTQYAEFLHSVRKNPSAAHHYIQIALEQMPEVVTTHSILAAILAAEGNLDGAEAEFKQALSIEPNNAATHNMYGLFLLNKRKDSKAAFEHFRISLMQDPTNESYKRHFLTTLKTKHPAYWLFWQYVTLKRTLRRYGIGLTLLLAIVVRIVYNATMGVPALQPVGLIVALLWVLLVLYTITINPIFNLMIKHGWIK